ncbi:unnamed protein product, partial [Polarella glacialis]
WIHPRFVPQLRQWFERLTCDDSEQDRAARQNEAREARAVQRQAGAGGPEGAVGTGIGGVSKEARTSREVLAGVSAASSAPAPAVAMGGVSAGGPAPAGFGGGFDAAPGGEGEAGENLGNPGDFRFSDVPKPENYLHTYRDLHSREHVSMLLQLREGTHRFLRSLFDEKFIEHASISAGFHYPVRTQYATLHMQLRVNSGSVCREDGRGVEVNTLIDTVKRDRHVFERDAETIRYQVTENVKVSLLAAAQEYEEQHSGETTCRQLTPTSYELGATAMPTIEDGDEDGSGEEDDESQNRSPPPTSDGSHEKTDARKKISKGRIGHPRPDADAALLISEEAYNQTASYLVNLQPAPGTDFHQVIYNARNRAGELYGPDPTYLYPLHISVSGFFEATGNLVPDLVAGMRELLTRELRKDHRIETGKVICTKTGYVLFDMQAPAITNFSQNLNTWSEETLGVHIRPKAVNHISLACNRPDPASRENIRAIYEPSVDDPTGSECAAALKTATFDLVLSKLLQRASFENFERDGPHTFQEIARIRVEPPLVVPRRTSFSELPPEEERSSRVPAHPFADASPEIDKE